MEQAVFQAAKPIWPAGKEQDMNITVVFRAIVSASLGKEALLRITGASLYRIYVNGIFAGHGPARGPHQYYRVEEWPIGDKLTERENVVALEVVGYNVQSFYLLDQPSFVQAEVIIGDKLAAATSAEEGAVRGGFTAYMPEARVERVQRYSFQRTLIEYYRMNPESDSWRELWQEERFSPIRCAETEPKQLIARGVSYPTFAIRSPLRTLREGTMRRQQAAQYERLFFMTDIHPKFKGYKLEELDFIVSDDLQELVTEENYELDQAYDEAPFTFRQGAFRTYDFGINYTGFIGASVACRTQVKLYLLFDEILDEAGEVDYSRMGSVNAVLYELEPGDYKLETMEPYTFRYLKLIIDEGECQIDRLYVRELANPDADEADFGCSDPALVHIFEAARETFKQNATDIYMDCPSRERAGWLCDSYFTGRVEYWLTGASSVEYNFLQNYLLPETFKHIPEGMLPMCYPADMDSMSDNPLGHLHNWGFWFVLELEEYEKRTGDTLMIQAFRPRVYSLLQAFAGYENSDGLLEKLDGWVFVEWSKANDFVQDVNYPINMLYAGALACAGRLYKDDSLLDKASAVRAVIREQSFNGQFFVDHAVRSEGQLRIGEEKTEVCQYYAFYFDVASPATHPELWRTLLESFGPARRATETYSDVYAANAFIGNYLRLDLLSRYGQGMKLIREIGSYFYYMAERTGTLWEHVGTSASCNHGFASHVVHWLYQEALGVQGIDQQSKIITIVFRESELARCSGALPVGEGSVMRYEWWKEQDSIHYRLSVPASYTVQFFNPEQLMVIPHE